MPYQFVFTEKVVIGGETRTRSNTVTAGGKIAISEPIADSTTDGAVALTVDVSQVLGVYIVCDQDVLLETNDGSSPDDTLSLTAGIPYVWYEGKYDPLIFSVDITALYVTNASGETANLIIEILVDPTV